MFKQDFDIKAYAEYIVIKFLIFLSKLIPQKWLYRLSHTLVKYHYSDVSSRRHLIYANMKRAFPDKRSNDIDVLVHDFLENYSYQICEALLLFTGRIDYRDMVTNLEEAIKDINRLKKHKKGIIFISGHFGNWEMIGDLLAKNSLPVILIGKELKNRYMNDKLLVPFRTRSGSISIGRDGAMMRIGRAMKNAEVTGLLIDQMIPPPNGVKIIFFGQEAYATKSIAQLKLKFNPEIIPLFSFRTSKGKFKIEFGNPVTYIAKEETDIEKKIEKITQHYTGILEQEIRKYPAQWQWSYDRWRTS